MDTKQPARPPLPAPTGSAIKQLTLGEAEALAKRTEYAYLAAGTKENPINWGDAGAFYLEGWNQGMKDAIAILKNYKPKGAKPNVRMSEGADK